MQAESSCVNISVVSPLQVSRAPLFFHSPPPPSLSSQSYTGRRDLLGFLERKRLQYLLRHHSRKTFDNSEEEQQKQEEQEESNESDTETSKEQDMMVSFESEPAARIAEQIVYRAKNNIKIKRRQKRKKILLTTAINRSTQAHHGKTIVLQSTDTTATTTDTDTVNDKKLVLLTAKTKSTQHNKIIPLMAVKTFHKQQPVTCDSTQHNHHHQSSKELVTLRPSHRQHSVTTTVMQQKSSHDYNKPATVECTAVRHKTAPTLSCPDNMGYMAAGQLTGLAEVQKKQSKPVSQYNGNIKVYHGLLYEQVRKEWRNTLTTSRLKKKQHYYHNCNHSFDAAANQESSISEFRSNDNQQSLSTLNPQESCSPQQHISTTSQPNHSTMSNSNKKQDTSPTNHKITFLASKYNRTLINNRQVRQLTGSTITPYGGEQKDKMTGIIQNGYGEQLQKQKEKTKHDMTLLRAKQRSEIYALNAYMRELEELKFKEAFQMSESDKV